MLSSVAETHTLMKRHALAGARHSAPNPLRERVSLTKRLTENGSVRAGTGDMHGRSEPLVCDFCDNMRGCVTILARCAPLF
jgi:hypothetical protein